MENFEVELVVPESQYEENDVNISGIYKNDVNISGIYKNDVNISGIIK